MKNRFLLCMNRRVVIATLTTDYDQVEPRRYCTSKNVIFNLCCFPKFMRFLATVIENTRNSGNERKPTYKNCYINIHM